MKEKIVQLVSKPVNFVIIYILLMIPTYILPYFGSNSWTLFFTGIGAGTAANASSEEIGNFIGGFLFLFTLHLIFYIGMIIITYFRANLIGKKWIVIFPILAAVFDLLPFINSIPLVPTIMNILAIIFAVKTDNNTQLSSNTNT